MDVKEYRKRYEAELAGASADAAATGKPFATRAAARPGDSSGIYKLLAEVGDAAAPTSERVAALNQLKAARFLGENFSPYRPAFLQALRDLMKPDVDPALRMDAAEALASERDPFAQDVLRKGLLEPADALVPAAKALQFLGYDDHADAAGIAGEVFRSSDDLPTKEAALRVLATDPASWATLEGLMLDKSQPRTLRALGATGLNFLDPQRFAALARHVVLDTGDFDDIRATSLGALANVAGEAGDNAAFVARVSAFAEGEGPEALSAPAARFMDGRR